MLWLVLPRPPPAPRVVGAEPRRKRASLAPPAPRVRLLMLRNARFWRSRLPAVRVTVPLEDPGVRAMLPRPRLRLTDETASLEAAPLGPRIWNVPSNRWTGTLPTRLGFGLKLLSRVKTPLDP